MKRIAFIAAAVCVIVVFVFTRNTSVGHTLAGLPGGPTGGPAPDFTRLTYRMYLFGLIPVGEARFVNNGRSVLAGGEVISLSGAGETAPYLSPLVKGEVSVTSSIDSATLSPLAFTQTLKVSGREDSVRRITYDQQAGIMTLGDVQREVPAGVQDPLSALYKLMRTDFDRTTTIGMDVNSNQKTYLLQGTVSQKDITVRNASYTLVTVAASAGRKDKNVYHRSRMNFVLSKQHANAPILIKVFAGGILVTAQLIDFQ
jgi:hypothetical protein